MKQRLKEFNKKFWMDTRPTPEPCCATHYYFDRSIPSKSKNRKLLFEEASSLWYQLITYRA